MRLRFELSNRKLNMLQSTTYQKEIRLITIQQLTAATTSIQLAIGWLNDDGILGLLQKKALQGVTVQLILVAKPDNAANQRSFGELTKKGIQITWLSDRFREHLIDHKFVVIDKSIVLTGNYNWGHRKAPRKEFLTVHNFPSLAKGFVHEFDYLEIYADLSEEDLRPINPVGKLLKKMDVLKVLIGMGDTEFLHLRLQELENDLEDENIAEIHQTLLVKDYGAAFELMKNFVNAHQYLRACIEPPIDNLRREIQRLEEEIASTSREFSETEKTLQEFSQLHSEELGDLLQKILFQSKLKAKKEAEADASKQAEFEEAKKDHEEYTESHEAAKKHQPAILTKQEKKELKKLYRQTSLQCHPDRVVEELHDQAEELFVELNKAYKANDLERVKEISQQLQPGIMLSKSEGITELKKLESTYKSLLQKLNGWQEKLNQLQEDPSYKAVNNIENWETYFKEKREILEQQLERLKVFNESNVAYLSA